MGVFELARSTALADAARFAEASGGTVAVDERHQDPHGPLSAEESVELGEMAALAERSDARQQLMIRAKAMVALMEERRLLAAVGSASERVADLMAAGSVEKASYLGGAVCDLRSALHDLHIYQEQM